MNWKYNKLTWFVRQRMWSFGLDICSYPNMAAMLAQCDFLVDVGANVGGFVAQVRRFGYRGPVTCFEPSPAVFKKLCERNDCEKQNVALSDRIAIQKFYMRSRDCTGDGLMRNGFDGESFLLETKRLDSFRFGPARRIFLKVDTEGHDLAVMRGATGLVDWIRFVMMETPVIPRFEGEPDFATNIVEMRKLGFVVTNFVGNIFEASRQRSQAFDLIFEPKGQVSNAELCDAATKDQKP